MEWYVFALVCALLSGLSTIVKKKVLIDEHTIDFSVTFTVLMFIISLPLLFLIDIHFTARFLLLTYIASLFGTVAFFFISKAMRHAPISIVSPLTNINPILLMVASFFILGERITFVQVFGIVIFVFGMYMLESRKHDKFLAPIKRIKKERALTFILISGIFYAVSSMLDKVILTFTQPLKYLIVVQFFVALNFIILTIYKYKNPMHLIKKDISGPLLLASILTLAQRLAQFQAVSLTYVSLVIPIKRSGALVSTLIGGELFHEKDLARKLIATIIIIFAAYLIIAGG